MRLKVKRMREREESRMAFCVGLIKNAAQHCSITPHRGSSTDKDSL